MKTKKLIFTFCITISFLLGSVAYSEGGESSSVTVFGPTEKSTSEDETYRPESSGEIPDQNSSAGLMYNISGSRMGGVQVSEPVMLPSEGEIMSVDAGLTGTFTIVRVDKDGKETEVLNVSPEHAIGKKLSKGMYKVYPVDLDGTFAFEKLTARVQIGLTGNKIMDPRVTRAGMEMLKTEKEQ